MVFVDSLYMSWNLQTMWEWYRTKTIIYYESQYSLKSYEITVIQIDFNYKCNYNGYEIFELLNEDTYFDTRIECMIQMNPNPNFCKITLK